jgi:hypothetical protein
MWIGFRIPVIVVIGLFMAAFFAGANMAWRTKGCNFASEPIQLHPSQPMPPMPLIGGAPR